jgi:hypothetical protein
MSDRVRAVSEGLARNTTRRRLFGHGLDVAFGLLAGAAAGTLVRPDSALAGSSTVCAFPGPPCRCDKCLSNGVCAKPCVILTAFYASGCWVASGNVTCCDCDCHGIEGIGWCGCGSDHHNNPQFCP